MQKAFKDYFTLSHNITFYVPSTQNVSEVISPDEFGDRVKETANFLTDLFGGASVETIQGYYKAHDQSYVVEDVKKVISGASDEQLQNNSTKILNYVKNKVREWSQESIIIEIDGKKLFID